MKKIVTVILVLAIFASLMISAAAASEPRVVVRNARDNDYNAVQWSDAKPFIDSGRTMVPLGPIADAMGLDVKWDDATKTAIFTGTYYEHPRVAYFKIGSDTITLETYERDYSSKITEHYKMDTTAVIVGGRTFAPVRYLAEVFTYGVNWDESSRTAKIYWRFSGEMPELAHTYKETIDMIIDFVDNRLDDYHAAIIAEYPYCDYDEVALAKMDANIAQLKACPSDLLGYYMFDYMYGYDWSIDFIECTIHCWLSCGGDGTQKITIQ